MKDDELVSLLFARDQQALAELKTKYGAYCYTVACNILRSREDAEECISDALLAVWKSIPPARPENLQMYLANIVRNTAISRWRKDHADKRGSGHIELLLEELSDAAAGDKSIEGLDDVLSLRESFNGFLRSLPKEQRCIFLLRYWYMLTVPEIAQRLGIGESKVKVTLHRTRAKLKKHLKERDNYE
ncbi:MAG: RNA polymerase sigma factor [Ruminococcus sp.]|nr:RNA polymerase sigma factor [Ruminococcus sp.]